MFGASGQKGLCTIKRREAARKALAEATDKWCLGRTEPAGDVLGSSVHNQIFAQAQGSLTDSLF